MMSKVTSAGLWLGSAFTVLAPWVPLADAAVEGGKPQNTDGVIIAALVSALGTSLGALIWQLKRSSTEKADLIKANLAHIEHSERESQAIQALKAEVEKGFLGCRYRGKLEEVSER